MRFKLSLLVSLSLFLTFAAATFAQPIAGGTIQGTVKEATH
jgi:hypothetical protein